MDALLIYTEAAAPEDLKGEVIEKIKYVLITDKKMSRIKDCLLRKESVSVSK